MGFYQALNAHFFGLLGQDELSSIAIRALEEGYDSPSLRQLASGDIDAQRAENLLMRALGELRLHRPNRAEAGLSLARDIAMEIVNGHIRPYEGARKIWQEIYGRCEELIQLRGFVGYASEYEDDEPHRDRYNELIIEESKRLLHG